MNKEELYDLIEQYLEGALPDTARQEVERRLATDADFRAEVEFHRAMHRSLGDTGNLRLRTALDTLLRNPPSMDDAPPPETGPTPVSSPAWPRLTGLMVLFAVVGFFVWYWTGVGDGATSPISPEPLQNQLQDTTSIPKSNIPPDSISAPNKLEKSRPIAMANPADFVPNPSLEVRIGDMVRGAGISVELTSPSSGAVFRLQNGQVTVPVIGIVIADTIPADRPLQFFIYSNRPEAWDNKQPLFSSSLPITLSDKGEHTVRFSPKWALKPGLYYIVVAQQRLPEDGEGYRTLWVGKFIARANTQ